MVTNSKHKKGVSAPLPERYRIHGFNKPLSPQQYQSWTLIILSFSAYYGFVVPFMPPPLSHIFLAIHLGVIVIGLSFFFHLSLNDPAHPNVAVARENAYHEDLLARKEGRFEKHETPGPKDGKICRICDISRENTTKHCNICGKCIIYFDHHCLFLNTCIGGLNYKSFFMLISLCSLNTILQLWCYVWLFINMETPAVKECIELSAFAAYPIAYWIVLGISLIFPLTTLGCFGTLLSFHIFICVRGISTYAWIMERRKIKAQKQEAKENERNEKRQEDLEKKREEIYRDWLKEKAAREKARQQERRSLEVQTSAKSSVELASTGSSNPSVLASHPHTKCSPPVANGSHVDITRNGISPRLSSTMSAIEHDLEQAELRNASEEESKSDEDDELVRKLSFVMGVTISTKTPHAKGEIPDSDDEVSYEEDDDGGSITSDGSSV